MSPEELTRMANDPKFNKAEIWKGSRDGVSVQHDAFGVKTGKTKLAQFNT